MDLIGILLIQTLATIATIVVFSFGLAIVFGMMRVINLAHGEFIMLGGYAAVIARQNGVETWTAILLVPPLVVGLFGVVVERLLMRRLYERPTDTLLASWGLSLFLIGMVTLIFGNTTVGIDAPLGGMSIGDYRIGLYNFVLIGVAVALIAAFYLLLRRTKAGTIARATMQNPQMAAALGINPNAVYAVTFGVGSALAGLAGGLMAPIAGVIPTMGGAFVAKAFITVICAGPAVVLGTGTAAALFGTVSQWVSYTSSAVMGEAALLVSAILFLRVFPNGLSLGFFRRAV